MCLEILQPFGRRLGSRHYLGAGLAAMILLAAFGASCSSSQDAGQKTLTRAGVMIRLPEAVSQIGDDLAPRDEQPAFSIRVREFLLDRSPVTVSQFRVFVEQMSYVTDAERLGSAGVMLSGMGNWIAMDGATWRMPQGPHGLPAVDDHPVTQVSWNDAAAYCAAYGARLPTEFEWERAARLGQTPDGTVFEAATKASWDAKLRLNTWQGVFPVADEGSDGFRGTSPVGAFGEAPSGLTDMAGNVWEWTSSSYLPYPAPEAENRAPAPERVQRGGSFLCSPDVCEGFRASARGHSTPDTSLMHVGFRCAADADAKAEGIEIRSPSPSSGGAPSGGGSRG